MCFFYGRSEIEMIYFFRVVRFWVIEKLFFKVLGRNKIVELNLSWIKDCDFNIWLVMVEIGLVSICYFFC